MNFDLCALVSRRLLNGLFLVGGCVLLLSGCDGTKPSENTATAAKTIVVDTARYTPVPLGAAYEGKPWISFTAIVDLDRDGLPDVLACDDKALSIAWVRQVSPGRFEETALTTGLPAPVHVEAVDIDGDGDLDLLVACMGEVFPNNDKIGSIVILENDGHQHFTKHVIIDHVARVTDVRAGDFNRDGKIDLAVAQFGYDQGEIQWMENVGDWHFKGHNLLNLSGTINVCVADFNGDGTPDIAALVSQQWEEIYLFENDGQGGFSNKILFGSTNEDFGSSGISVCDLNRDGRPDILYTNGDGFAYADPGKRPWHGVQWLENRGNGSFGYHRIGNLAGAFSPVGVDLNGDGAMDVVAVSGFNDWKDPKAIALAAFMNDGKMNFTLHVLAHEPTQLMTCAAGDLDGSGKISLVTGGFYSYPPFDHMSRLTLWRSSDGASPVK